MKQCWKSIGYNSLWYKKKEALKRKDTFWTLKVSWCRNGQTQMKKKRGKEGINKWRLVFHELCISKAVLYAHIHQLATREGIGQQCTSNTGGTELGVGGGKAQHLGNCWMWYLYCSWVSKWVKKENRKLQELSNITHRWRFMRTFDCTSSFWLL